MFEYKAYNYSLYILFLILLYRNEDVDDTEDYNEENEEPMPSKKGTIRPKKVSIYSILRVYYIALDNFFSTLIFLAVL